MSDIIDLTGASSKKKASKKTTKAAPKAKAKVKTAPKAKVASKKKAAPATRTRHTEDSITAPVRKAFASWKKGEQSLADVVSALKAESRNAIWIQFRVLAGGEDELHRLRAAGAGAKRGKLRFGAKGKAKGKVKGKAKGKK